MRPIRPILEERLKKDIIGPPPEYYHGPVIDFSRQPEEFTDLINSYPGSGKTRGGLEFADWLWREHRLTPLYLMLRHGAIDEGLEGLGERKADWAHWRGHGDNCRAKQFFEMGYPEGAPKCNCKQGTPRTADKPTLAPIDYVLADLLDIRWDSPRSFSSRPVTDFKLWIVDEVDLSRFVGSMDIPLNEVETASKEYPVELFRRASKALVRTLSGTRDGAPLSGPELHERLDHNLRMHGLTLDGWLDSLRSTRWPTRPWNQHRRKSLPHNFPPYLVALLRKESGEANANVHFVNSKSGPIMKLRWKKELIHLADDTREYSWRPGIFVMDATANEGLLQEALSASLHVKQLPEPKWPKNVKVYQFVDKLMSMSDLGLRPHNDASKREKWYSLIQDHLGTFPRTRRVGIVTFKEIESEAVATVKALGFKHVQSLHYGGERSSNALKDVHVLVLLGCPMPNPEDFKVEAQAFFSNHSGAPALEFDWGWVENQIEMRDGWQYKLRVRGYQSDQRVRDYFCQKCQATLYQALFRIRPYDRKRYDRHIFVYTNIPIRGVKVDSLLGGEATRFQMAVNAIQTRMAQGQPVSVPELAESIAQSNEKARSVETWIARNGSKLEQATGSRFKSGARRRPGRFVPVPKE